MVLAACRRPGWSSRPLSWPGLAVGIIWGVDQLLGALCFCLKSLQGPPQEVSALCLWSPAHGVSLMLLWPPQTACCLLPASHGVMRPRSALLPSTRRQCPCVTHSTVAFLSVIVVVFLVLQLPALWWKVLEQVLSLSLLRPGLAMCLVISVCSPPRLFSAAAHSCLPCVVGVALPCAAWGDRRMKL